MNDDKRERFSALVEGWLNCERCILHETRKNVVFARGSFDPQILFIGEAPTASEDEEGRPFVGRSGKILDELIFESGLADYSHASMNVLGCRPLGEAEPTFFQIKLCKKRFDGLLDILAPKLLVVMGATASRKIVGVQSVSRWRGALVDADLLIGREIRKYKTLVTYHPAYLLRSGVNSPMRETIIADFKKAKKVLNRMLANSGELKNDQEF